MPQIGVDHPLKVKCSIGKGRGGGGGGSFGNRFLGVVFEEK